MPTIVLGALAELKALHDEASVETLVQGRILCYIQ